MACPRPAWAGWRLSSRLERYPNIREAMARPGHRMALQLAVRASGASFRWQLASGNRTGRVVYCSILTGTQQEQMARWLLWTAVIPLFLTDPGFLAKILTYKSNFEFSILNGLRSSESLLKPDANAISRTFSRGWWGKKDSNLRSHKTADLQSTLTEKSAVTLCPIGK